MPLEFPLATKIKPTSASGEVCHALHRPWRNPRKGRDQILPSGNLVSGLLHDKYTEGIGNSLFTHSNGMSSNSYYDEYWEPEFEAVPEIPENV